MVYEVGEYLFHSDHGVGIIHTVSDGDNPDITIDFENNPGLVLTELLVNHGCGRLSPDGYRVFAYHQPEEDKRLQIEDPVVVVEMVLQDFTSQQAKTDDLKNYLTPYVSDWNKWWKNVQPKLKLSTRIDTSRSRFREYGLYREHRSRADEAFQYFRKLRSKPDIPQEQVYKQARSVLAEFTSGSVLDDYQTSELRNYFSKLIEDTEEPINLRLDAVFRLEENGWFSESEVVKELRSLLTIDLRLYDLDNYAQNRLLDYLLQNQDRLPERSILLSGICASYRTMQLVNDFALETANPDWIANLILNGLTENIPLDMKFSDYPLLSGRLKILREMVNALPTTSTAWDQIVEDVGKLLIQFGEIKDPTQIAKLPFISFAKFVNELFLRITERKDNLSNALIDNLANPNLPSEILVALLEGGRKAKILEDFIGSIEDRLLQKIEGKHHELLTKLLQRDDKGKSQYADQLAGVVSQYPENSYVIDKAGTNLLELCQQSQPDEWISLLPSLELFSRLDGIWSWQTGINEFRRKAYLDVLIEPGLAPTGEDRRDSVIQDPELLHAIKDYIDREIDDLRVNIEDLKRDLEIANRKKQDLQKVIADQETVMRELRSGMGGDVQEARFEERQRVLRNLASTVAEFERYLNARDALSPDLQAIMRRLNSLLISNQVTAMEDIGTVIKFDPAKVRMSEGEVCSPGDEVVVIERGFQIHNSRGDITILKPAICKVYIEQEQNH